MKEIRVGTRRSSIFADRRPTTPTTFLQFQTVPGIDRRASDAERKQVAERQRQQHSHLAPAQV